MHKNCMDVAFEVHKSAKYSTKEWTLKGRWINLGYMGDPWYLTDKVTIKVPSDKKADWVNIADCYTDVRYKSGLPYRSL